MFCCAQIKNNRFLTQFTHFMLKKHLFSQKFALNKPAGHIFFLNIEIFSRPLGKVSPHRHRYLIAPVLSFNRIISIVHRKTPYRGAQSHFCVCEINQRNKSEDLKMRCSETELNEFKHYYRLSTQADNPSIHYSILQA